MRRSNENGSATMWLISLLMLPALALVGGVLVAAAAKASAHAESGADLTALAAASALSRRDEDPCKRAAEIAKRNGVVVRRCVIEGLDVRVWTEVDVPVLSRFGIGPAHARARAGPVLRSAS